MPEILLGLGSNIEPEANLHRAAEALRRLFGEVRFSAVYRSAAVGMQGDDFLNACCLLRSQLPLHELKQLLKRLEDAQQRDRSQGSWKPRTLDLDVLMYGGEVVDDELYRYAHAYVPAAELVDLELPVDEAGCVRRHALRL
ncbi:MAG TPA: 2-amino-4-hydroxy-6-hydroxymethyldihydropteridine diphosphokinase [Mariprofundaceae bacterium]|nr:2-amino-4-hydroxy-6-hydroxymethyldihydropteridine diphosphokinase [Mariprofundaceae bacterium]